MLPMVLDVGSVDRDLSTRSLGKLQMNPIRRESLVKRCAPIHRYAR